MVRGYEPSEASIEKSVMMAKGFNCGGDSMMNFSASTSDIVDDVTLMRLELQRLGSGSFDDGDNDGHGSGGWRRRGTGC